MIKCKAPVVVPDSSWYIRYNHYSQTPVFIWKTFFQSFYGLVWQIKRFSFLTNRENCHKFAVKSIFRLVNVYTTRNIVLWLIVVTINQNCLPIRTNRCFCLYFRLVITNLPCCSQMKAIAIYLNSRNDSFCGNSILKWNTRSITLIVLHSFTIMKFAHSCLVNLPLA